MKIRPCRTYCENDRAPLRGDYFFESVPFSVLWKMTRQRKQPEKEGDRRHRGELLVIAGEKERNKMSIQVRRSFLRDIYTRRC